MMNITSNPWLYSHQVNTSPTPDLLQCMSILHILFHYTLINTVPIMYCVNTIDPFCIHTPLLPLRSSQCKSQFPTCMNLPLYTL